MEGQQRYKNSLDCAMKVLKTEGVRGLYRGFSASLIGLSESTLQFVTYEYFKAQLIKSKGLARQDVKWYETLGIAASAKLFAAVLTYPHEVVRTRMRQTPEAGGRRKYIGFAQTAKLIFREEGAAGLYGGMTAHILRVVPNAAILFLMYEAIIRIGTAAKSDS